MKTFSGFVLNDKDKSVSQYVYFRCGMTYVKKSLGNLGTTFKVQNILKKEMKHEDVYADTWRTMKDEWLDYVNNEVLCTACSYGRF